ncbi:MAG: hypothetical protein ABW154_06060 [Dyella sp.]
MSMSAAVASADHRQRLLRALGVTPWVRRVPVSISEVDSPAGAISSTDCVVVLPAGCTARELDLLGRALHSFGAALARAARVSVHEGALSSVPSARAYLVFGQAQAHALGRQLPAAVMNEAHIALVELPQSSWLSGAAAKRQLWMAMRGLRRALTQTG